MISLHARLDRRWEAEPILARITEEAGLPEEERGVSALLLSERTERVPPDFAAVLVREMPEEGSSPSAILVPPALRYLGAGDVVRINPWGGEMQVMYRRHSHHNSLLVTERCNSRCLMCSQPPRDEEDGYLVEELLALIPLIHPETARLGLTGGEPTLLHDGFLRLLAATRDHLPQTRLDVLTNGRLLAYLEYARRIAAVGHPDLILCVPLYSDVDSLHDWVVQAEGAYDQTLRGLMNLARVGVPVEIRVVIHQQTYRRLPQLAAFIARNLPFVGHVALMGLEITGFTKPNRKALWVDPLEYGAELVEAVERLDTAGIPTSIYNHPLCLLPESLWGFARQSISDWKESFLPECAACGVRQECGGVFGTSGTFLSPNIRPLVKPEAALRSSLV